MKASVKELIKQSIWRKRKGAILFSDDFLSIANRTSVNKALSDLCKEGVIVRVASGIYFKPRIDTELGLGLLYPSLEEIAKAIADRDHSRIIPTGVYAQNQLGLSTQVPMNAVYLTDATPRRIKVYGGRGILFKHVSPKNLNFKSDLAMMLTLALRDIGEGNVDNGQKAIIKKIIHKVPKEQISRDYPLMPDWVRNLIESLYD